MIDALLEKRLPDSLAGQVSRNLFALPGFRAGRHDDAEALHQQLLALRRAAIDGYRSNFRGLLKAWAQCC